MGVLLTQVTLDGYLCKGGSRRLRVDATVGILWWVGLKQMGVEENVGKVFSALRTCLSLTGYLEMNIFVDWTIKLNAHYRQG